MICPTCEHSGRRGFVLHPIPTIEAFVIVPCPTCNGSAIASCCDGMVPCDDAGYNETEPR